MAVFEKMLYLGKVVLFGKIDCTWAKLVVFGQCGCFRQSDCIWAKMVLFGPKDCKRSKLDASRQIGCNRANLYYLDKSGFIRENL